MKTALIKVAHLDDLTNMTLKVPTNNLGKRQLDKAETLIGQYVVSFFCQMLMVIICRLTCNMYLQLSPNKEQKKITTKEAETKHQGIKIYKRLTKDFVDSSRQKKSRISLDI